MTSIQICLGTTSTSRWSRETSRSLEKRPPVDPPPFVSTCLLTRSPLHRVLKRGTQRRSSDRRTFFELGHGHHRRRSRQVRRVLTRSLGIRLARLRRPCGAVNARSRTASQLLPSGERNAILAASTSVSRATNHGSDRRRCGDTDCDLLAVQRLHRLNDTSCSRSHMRSFLL